MTSVAIYWASNGHWDKGMVLFLAVLYLECKNLIDEGNDKDRNKSGGKGLPF